MKTIKITSANADNNNIISLYEEAFPETERLPYADLIRLTDEIPMDFTVYYDGDKFIGFTIVCPMKKYNWFWYFAVKSEFRGNGYGSQILSHIIQKYNEKPLILDMEAPDQPDAPNKEQRTRRTEFYVRNGFHDTHVHKTFDSITYTMMMFGDHPFTISDYDEVIGEMMKYWQPLESMQRNYKMEVYFFRAGSDKKIIYLGFEAWFENFVAAEASIDYTVQNKTWPDICLFKIDGNGMVNYYFANGKRVSKGKVDAYLDRCSIVISDPIESDLIYTCR